MTQTQRLARILEDLDKAADYLDSRGFATQSNLLDSAADAVETVKDSLEAL